MVKKKCYFNIMEDIVIIEDIDYIDTNKNDYEDNTIKLENKFDNIIVSIRNEQENYINEIKNIIKQQEIKINKMENIIENQGKQITNYTNYIKEMESNIKQQEEKIINMIYLEENRKSIVVNLLNRVCNLFDKVEGIEKYKNCDTRIDKIFIDLEKLKEDIKKIKSGEKTSKDISEYTCGYVTELYYNVIDNIKRINDRLDSVDDQIFLEKKRKEIKQIFIEQQNNIDNKDTSSNNSCLINQENIENISKLTGIINILSKQFKFFEESCFHIDTMDRKNYDIDISIKEINTCIESISNYVEELSKNIDKYKNLC